MTEVTSIGVADTAFDNQIGNRIQVSDAAKAKLSELLVDTDDDVSAVRVFVSGGGCGGMTYGMTFTDTRSDYDVVLEEGDLRIYVDAVAISYLEGAEIDYTETGMGQASFVFRNVFASVGGSGVCGGCAGAGGGGCA